jgi:uncharacterized protein (TIGR03083 family)
MAKADIWAMIHRERAALADDLATLTPEQWDQPSQCEGWSVRDVVAHMTASAMISPVAFFAKIVGSGFSLTRMQNKDIARERGASEADALERFRAQISSTKHPPGPTDTWLGEAMIHAEDIRRPLGIEHEYDVDAAVRVADFYKGSNLVVGAKKRVAGLRLQAVDADWSHGDGPQVSGPVMSLVMAMTGRRAALADLSGDGVATLRARAE